jgi:phage anti-repressor protein
MIKSLESLKAKSAELDSQSKQLTDEFHNKCSSIDLEIKKRHIRNLLGPKWDVQGDDSYDNFLHYFVMFKELEENSIETGEKYPILLSDLSKWLGYKREDKLRENMKRNFKENQDFSFSPHVGGKSKGRPKKIFKITIQCFKEIALSASTSRGKQVKLYFLAVEDAFKKLINNEKKAQEYKDDINHKTKQLDICFDSNKDLNDPEVAEWLKDPSKDIKRKNVKRIRKLLEQGKKIVLSKYHLRHVFYYFVTSIKNEKDDRFVIKFGYSSDIQSRIKSLQDHYKSTFKLVGLKLINREADEDQFHKLIRLQYPHTHYYFKVKNKGKDEIYYFDSQLTKEFNAYDVHLRERDDDDIKIAEAILKMSPQQLEVYKLYLQTKI